MLLEHGPDTDLFCVLNIPYALEVVFFLFEYSKIVVAMSMSEGLKHVSIGIIVCHLSVSQWCYLIEVRSWMLSGM